MTRIAIASVLLLVLHGYAQAQSSPWQAEERTTGGWTLTPGTAIGGFWDSGIQIGDNQVIGTLFQKWVGNASPYAELDYNGRRSHVNLGYAGMFEKYWGAGMRWEQQGRASVRRAVSPHVTVNGDASYSRVPTTDRLEFTDGTAMGPSLLPFADVTTQFVNARAGLSWQAGPRTSVFGSYRFERVSLDNGFGSNQFVTPLGSLRDGYSHSPSLGFSREMSSRLSLGATAAYSRQYVGDGGFFLGQTYDIKTLTGELSYRWSAVTSLTAGAGVSVLDETNTELQTTSPAFHIGVARQMRVWRLGGRYERSIQQLFGFGTLAPTHSVSGDAYVPFGDRRYYLAATVTYVKTNTIENLPLGINLSTLWTNVAVGRQLLPRLRGEAYFSVARQDGGTSDSASRTRVGIQLVTSKPLRIQ